MAGLRRRILGITVISAGVCAALPFRNEAVDVPGDRRGAVDSRTSASSRNELTLQLTLPATPLAAQTPLGHERPVSAVAKTKPPSQPQEVRRDQLQSPPSIASTFEPIAATPPIATFPVATVGTPTTNSDQREQRHRIVDGDTLATLAERYCGNRDQWRSIFEANRSLLRDPNILPIGQELVIPHVRSRSRGVTDDHLVPIPPGILTREVR